MRETLLRRWHSAIRVVRFWLGPVLLGLGIAALVGLMVLLAISFIGEALVPAAVIAALGWILGEMIKVVLGDIGKRREASRRQIRLAEERIREWRLALIRDAQRLVEGELDAMRAHVTGRDATRPRPARYERIRALRVGQLVGSQLEKLASAVYMRENAGMNDADLLAKIDQEERLMTGQLQYREYLAIHEDEPSRLEGRDREPSYRGNRREPFD